MRFSNKEKDNALNEISILANVNHPNIITYHESFLAEENKSLCIVMDFADAGDLLHVIREKTKNEERFTEDEVWSYVI